jgi:hypothetical protein
MKVRIPTVRKNGRSGEIHGASARRPAPLGADAEAFRLAEVRDLRSPPSRGLRAVARLSRHDRRRVWARRRRFLPVGLASDQRDLARPGRGNAGHGACAPLGATWRARAGSLSAHLVSVGIMIWLNYGYAHLSIGASFNAMFLVYVAVLTLAGFCLPVRGIFYCRKQKSPLSDRHFHAIQAVSRSQA